MIFEKTYIGYSRNNEFLKKCASGGVASTLAHNFIENDGVVIGVKYSTDFYFAEFFVAKNVEDIRFLTGSKYIFSRKCIHNGEKSESLFAVFEKYYNTANKILFIGLPCECHMMESYMNKKHMSRDKVFFVDLICQGTLPENVHEKFLKNLEKKYKAKIVGLNVKTTINNWRSPVFMATFSNGKIFKKNLYSTDYGLFFSMYSRKNCYSCRFKGENRSADLTIGDFWSSSSDSNDIINKLGTSFLGVHNQKGKKLIFALKTDDFFLKEVSEEVALKNNPMFYQCRKKSDGWNVVQDELEHKSVHYVIKKHIGIFKYYLLKIMNSQLFKH